MKSRISDLRMKELLNESQKIRDYKNALKMLDSAWNRFNYSGTLSSIYHLKSCEEYLNEIVEECIKNNVTYTKINVKILED